MTHRLLREGKARVVIASGENPEAEVLGRQIEDWGISRDRIIVEGRARNTHENAVFSQEIARARGFERVLIVTSAFHMQRAAECFAAVGMKVDTLSVDYRRAPEMAGRRMDHPTRRRALAEHDGGARGIGSPHLPHAGLRQARAVKHCVKHGGPLLSARAATPSAARSRDRRASPASWCDRRRGRP